MVEFIGIVPIAIGMICLYNFVFTKLYGESVIQFLHDSIHELIRNLKEIR